MTDHGGTVMSSSMRPRCRLSAVNGSVDALIFQVERTLELTGAPELAAAFTAEVSSYRARRDATYRGILCIASVYVDLC